MNIEERLTKANEKERQYEHQKILQDNRRTVDKSKIDLRRKILIGELFMKHFPIALEFTPGKSSDEDNKIFEPLDDFMESLSKCQQSFQTMEDALCQMHQHQL